MRRCFSAVLLTALVVAAPILGVASVRSATSVAGEAVACPPGEPSTVSVLVAVQLIPKGTAGPMLVRQGFAKAYTLPCAEVKPGAYRRPADLRGRVAAHDIFPGHQLTRADFSRASSAAQAPAFRIDHVIDGDTVELRNGQRVRLVQIDAPEVFSEAECYGRQASATTRRVLPPGTRVRLAPEPTTERVDDDGRLLRYVVRVRDGMNVNLRLVALGAAAPYFFEGRRGKYAELLEYLAETAWAKPVGFWRACPRTLYNPYRGVDTRR